MVVSKLWLAGHLLPDLKPYTRHERRPEAQQQRWLGAASGSSGSSGAGCAIASSGSGAGSGSADLPPLAELLLSRDSVASLGGAGSGSSGSLGGEEASPVSSRASILDSITAGSSTPTDIVQLLVESVALNSTANIIREDDGGRGWAGGGCRGPWLAWMARRHGGWLRLGWRKPRSTPRAKLRAAACVQAPPAASATGLRWRCWSSGCFWAGGRARCAASSASWRRCRSAASASA